MIKQSLPGIKRLGYVAADRLQRQSMHKSIVGIPVGVFTDITLINFVGTPTCEVESDYDNNGRLENTTLRFATNDNIPIYKPIAFVFTDVNGDSWLLGTREKPRPIIKVERSTGQPGGDENVYAFNVTMYAHKALIKCEI